MAMGAGLHDCDDCTERECEEPREGGPEDMLLDAIGARWIPSCPRKLLHDPLLQAVIGVHNAAELSPLSDWPDGYAAWVPEGWLALRRALAEKRDNERAKNGAGDGNS